MQLPVTGWPGPRAWSTPTAPLSAPTGGAPAATPTSPLGLPWKAAFTKLPGRPNAASRARAWSAELWSRFAGLTSHWVSLQTALARLSPVTTAASVQGYVDGGSFAQQVVDLTNRERSLRGLPPLKGRFGLQFVAERRATDMIRRGYFAHTDPDGRDPFWQLRAHGVGYRTAGENIASGQRTPEAVVEAWMKSPGHRANILNPRFGHLGVGAVLNSATGQIYWTQLFSD